MASRVRAVLMVGVLAASLLPLAGTTGSSEGERRSIGDAVAPSRAHRPAPAPASPRDWRLTPAVSTVTRQLPWVLAVFALSVSGMVGRRLRRIGDNGDDWRSLLEGAPPAVA